MPRLFARIAGGATPVPGAFADRPRTGGWRRLRRACRLGCAGLAASASLGLACPANANGGGRWRPHPDVGLLDSSQELREAARKSGQEIKERGLNGFSILRRNTKTGELVCDVYVVKMTGTFVDEARTTTFGHEVLHCLGLRHD